MSGKNLTFKLVLDADNKGLVSTAKNSETVMKAVFDSIKSESDKLKQASSEASSEVGNLVPSDTKQKVAQLVTELTSASKALDAMGSDADLSADNLKLMGDYGHKALSSLQEDLKQAKLHLNYLSATNATPADIQNAQQEVRELETGVRQVKTAFDAYKSSADGASTSTAEASKEIGNIVPKGTTDLADKLTQSLNAATGIIKNAGDNAKSTAGNFTDFGNKAEKALSQLKTDLTQAKQKLQEFASTNASPADIEKAKLQVDQLEKEVQQADQAFNNFHAEVGKANTKLNETDSAAQTAQKGISGLKTGYTALIGVMGGIGIGLGIRELAQAADSYTNLSARINIATKDGGDFTSAMAGVHQVALMTNSSLEATGSLFTRLNAVGKDMGMTQQQALNLTKTVTQAIQVGGGSAQASEAAVQQFIQAMQGGVLRGEEFNSILENGIGVAEALARGLGITTGELRKMAENGELSAERVVKAIQSQADQVQATYNKFPTTIANALQRIATSWQIVIGEMDQANGASATVAGALVDIADNLGIIKVFLDDVSLGFASLVGDIQGGIDSSTIEAFKNAISSAYDAVKDLVKVVYELGVDALDIVGTSLNSALSIFSSFTGGVTEAGEQVGFLERILQGLSITFGFISDGATAIKIALGLLTGGFFDLASAASSVMAALTWGDVSKQFAANADAMKQKAKEYYAEADREAQEFNSKGVARLAEAAQTETEKNAEMVASSKAKLDEILTHQQTEVDGRKVTEAEKLSAVQSYAEAAIAANNGVMDGTMQADLMTKGYIVTLDQSGKVSVQAWNQNKEGAESTANATDKARKAATALGLDLDVSLNRVSAKFKESETSVNNFVAGLKGLGVEGKQAGEMTYQAWLKWLETAKSQAEIDFAKAKLKEFGDQGQISTSQVEQGLIAIKLQAQELPDDIDPVTEAFKRLGIETKANLKLAAQQALMDYITIRDSGKATAEGVENAYRKAAQAAATSGDAGVVASTNAANAGRNLEVQIDSTGKAVVKTMDEWSKSNDRVRNSAERIGDGYRHTGNIAREEAKSSTEAWSDAVAAASKQFDAEMKRQSKSLSNGIYNYNSYSKADVLSQLKSKGYSDKEAEKLAGTIWSEAMAADRAAKEDGLGKDGNLGIKALINQEFDAAAAKGLTTQHGTNKINDLLRQMTASNLVSTGPSTRPVDVNSLAPNVSMPAPSTTATPTSRTVQNNISINGKTISIPVAEENQGNFNDFLSELEMLKKRS